MKRLIIVSLAVIGLAACTSNPYKPAAVEPRKPSNLGGASTDSVSNVSDASVGFVSDTIQASIDVTKVSTVSSTEIKASDKGVFGPFSTSVNASKEIAIVGWTLSKNASQLIVVSASEAGKLADATSAQIVTTSGSILNASVNSSRTAFRVTVQFSKDAAGVISDAAVYVGNVFLGTVKFSAETSAKAANWVSDATVTSANWSVDTSGRLYHDSKELVGVVLDTSGNAIGIVADASGKALIFSKDVSLAVIKGSGNLISQLAKDAASASKSAGQFLVGKVVSTAQKSVVYVKWSGRQSVNASKFVFHSIRNLLHSEPEERPDSSSAAPASSAAAPDASGSQSN